MVRDEQRFQPYTLFVSKVDAGLSCAIRVDRPVPRFLESIDWQYSGRLTDATSAPRDFNARAARSASDLNGYYLFAALQS